MPLLLLQVNIRDVSMAHVGHGASCGDTPRVCFDRDLYLAEMQHVGTQNVEIP